MATIIQAGWGYNVEFRGNIRGEFQRAMNDIAVKIQSRGKTESLVILPDGRRAQVNNRALITD